MFEVEISLSGTLVNVEKFSSDNALGAIEQAEVLVSKNLKLGAFTNQIKTQILMVRGPQDFDYIARRI